MANFSQLPNEMVSEIWSYVLEPRDVESFALVSKYIHAIGRPFVAEHNALTKKYSAFNTCKTHAANLLEDVLLRPRIALYVTHFCIDGFQSQWGVPPDDSSDDDEWSRTYHKAYPDDVMAMFIEAIQQMDHLLPEDVRYSIEEIKTGDEDQILALLIVLLPNISTIKFEDSVSRFDPEVCYESIRHSAEQTRFLTRLRTLDLGFQGRYAIGGTHWFKYLGRLPLVHSIDIRFQHLCDLHHILRNIEFFRLDTSTPMRLTLTCADLGPKFVIQLSTSIKGLVESSCVGKGTTDVGSEEFGKFCFPLTHATRSLESLRILSLFKCKDEGLGSLHEFAALKELEIELSLLIRREDEPDSFLETLPVSIEKLHLHTKDQLMIMPTLAKSIMQEKSQLFPHLRVLKIEVKRKGKSRSRVWKAMNAMKEEGRKIGIELELIGF